MNGCKCKFYECDEAAKKEAEEMEAAYRASMSEKQWAEMEAWAATMPEDYDDPFKDCGAFCKHLSSGKGHPGEYLYYCTSAGNEHIIHADFNESEII